MKKLLLALYIILFSTVCLAESKYRKILTKFFDNGKYIVILDKSDAIGFISKSFIVNIIIIDNTMTITYNEGSKDVVDLNDYKMYSENDNLVIEVINYD